MSGREMEIGPAARAVGANVYRLRRAHGMTAVTLSELLKDQGRPIPANSIRRLENGERRIDVDDLAALAHILGVAIADLVTPQQICPACSQPLAAR